MDHSLRCLGIVDDGFEDGRYGDCGELRILIYLYIHWWKCHVLLLASVFEGGLVESLVSFESVTLESELVMGTVVCLIVMSRSSSVLAMCSFRY